jgi:hypothetical protein
VFFMILGSNRLVRKCNDTLRLQKREIVENLRERNVITDGVSYQRQSTHLWLNCVNP